MLPLIVIRCRNNTAVRLPGIHKGGLCRCGLTSGINKRFVANMSYILITWMIDDILISSIDDPSREESMLAGVKYMINTPLSADTENEEGSFTCEHISFSYESADTSAEMPCCAIEIVPTM